MRIYILTCGLLFAVACGSDSTTKPKPNMTWDVFTLSTSFSSTISGSIARGDTVRFSITPSQNGEGHNVIFNKIAGAPPDILETKSGVFTRVFTTLGTFHFECTIHPGMNGDIVVQ